MKPEKVATVNKVNPEASLTTVLGHLPDHKINPIAVLMPRVRV